ncbi:hypothetical protein RJT34_16098 [Clitoria ternatea]|uniref:TF-B3 domain-containing protein n=1 Tax=Clitoria ternatea TaxID=43366 RepID=A0AAN9J6K8_CLITE
MESKPLTYETECNHVNKYQELNIKPMANKFPCQLQVKPIHFFKIITAQSLREGKLMIPCQFVEKYGEGLPDTLFLKPPTGAEWKMNLEKCYGKIWLQKGWKEFADYHSLAHGHLLLFKCETTSLLQVQIFDMSALEIDYPFKTLEGKMASNDQVNNPLGDENLECHRPALKRKRNSSLECLQLCKMSSGKCVKVENTLKFPKMALVPHHSDTKYKEKSKAIIGKKVTALDKASSFESCNPFFMVLMRPSYIHARAPLSLPSKFCRSHFDMQKEAGDMNLRVLNERVWLVGYRIRDTHARTRFEVVRGWKAFQKGNKLKEVRAGCQGRTKKRNENDHYYQRVSVLLDESSTCNLSSRTKYLAFCRDLPDSICSSAEITVDF